MSSFKGTLGGDKTVVSGGKGKLAVKVVGYRSDVEPGEGALYLTPNGWVAVVINGGNAAKAIGVTTGEVVVLSKEEKPSGEGNVDSIRRLLAAV